MAAYVFWNVPSGQPRGIISTAPAGLADELANTIPFNRKAGCLRETGGLAALRMFQASSGNPITEFIEAGENRLEATFNLRFNAVVLTEMTETSIVNRTRRTRRVSAL